ncbi:MAG: DUF2975 domain-containing protein [Petrimonas sp.]|nr:DUF2975 domain-containing protein [Petrimonas sp.]
MKTKNVSLAFLALLTGLIYLLSFIITIMNSEDYFNQLFDGLNENIDVLDVKTGDFYREKETIKLYLRHKEGSNSFPDTITNLKTDVRMRADYNLITVRYNNIEDVKENIVTSIISFIISIFFLYAFIAIPIVFYKLILSVYRNDIFNNRNVKRLNRMGILYLTAYFSMILLYYLQFIRIKRLIELKDYDITLMPIIDSTSGMLLLGVILFIMGNVMSRAIKLKEEQDLTI